MNGRERLKKTGGCVMSDLVERVTGDMNALQKILSKVPGFSGYVDRTNRRQADKLLREVVAAHFEALWQRVSAIQKDLLQEPDGIQYMSKVESAALKLRQFIDRVRTAAYGYAGFFDAVKINQEELDRVYQYDLALLTLEDEVSRAIDNLEASMGTDGLPAAIRDLTKKTQACLDTFNHRQEEMIGGVEQSPTPPAA
jgi:hypothetical protein